MAEFRDYRLRLFFGFLMLVLILVNSQSLQLSHSSRKMLAASFSETARARAELVAGRLAEWSHSSPSAEEVARLSRRLGEAARAAGVLSACLLDLNGRLLLGSADCRIERVEDRERLGPGGRVELLERGWTISEVAPFYDPERATAFGYLALKRPDGALGSVLRVELGARRLAELNQSLRRTLLYQVSALALVLLTLLLFLNSLLAPHRRLMAAARSVGGEPPSSGSPEDEGQFLLATFQGVVARLKEKEQQLAEMHRREKARADETEALASNIIRSMTTGLVSLDSAGRVALVNPATEKLFGVEANQLAGKPFSEALPNFPELAGWVEAALSQGKFVLRRRVNYRRGADDTVYLGVSVIPLLGGAGEQGRGAICLFADLTEVIQLRERLFLKENLARLGEMVAGIAHEFRNSLATILGNAKLLKHVLPDGEAASLVSALLEEGNSLSRVVTEFLQFARPETLRVEPFDLFRLAADLARDLEPLAAEAGVSLAVEGAPCQIEADEGLVRKAISNLVLNAIDAAAEGPAALAKPPGGRGRALEEGLPGGNSRQVRIAIGEESACRFVRVSDSGTGIPAEDLPRIFAPFFTTKALGTGLGLALVQKIAVLHNGQVEVRSEPGQGAIFTLTLPCSPQTARAAEEWL